MHYVLNFVIYHIAGFLSTGVLLAYLVVVWPFIHCQAHHHTWNLVKTAHSKRSAGIYLGLSMAITSRVTMGSTRVLVVSLHPRLCLCHDAPVFPADPDRQSAWHVDPLLAYPVLPALVWVSITLTHNARPPSGPILLPPFGSGCCHRLSRLGNRVPNTFAISLADPAYLPSRTAPNSPRPLADHGHFFQLAGPAARWPTVKRLSSPLAQQHFGRRCITALKQRLVNHSLVSWLHANSITLLHYMYGGVWGLGGAWFMCNNLSAVLKAPRL